MEQDDTHPPASRLLLQPGATLPVTAGLDGTTLNLPEVALLKRLKDVAAETFDDELDKVFPVDQPSLEKPNDDDMVGKGECVVVELEGVGVGKGDGEYREKLLRVKTFSF